MDIEVQRETKAVTPSPELMNAFEVLAPKPDPLSHYLPEQANVFTPPTLLITSNVQLPVNKRLTPLENAEVVNWLKANHAVVITKPSAELAVIVTADLGFEVSKAEINLRRNALNLQRVKPKPEAALLPEQMICEAIADLAAIVARLCASDEERQRVNRIQARFSGFTY